MWFGKFGRQLRSLERLEHERAKANPPPPTPVYSAIARTWRELRAAVKAARAAGADLIVHTIVRPTKRADDPPPPRSPARIEHEPEQRARGDDVHRAEQAQPEHEDRYGFERMSIERLHDEGRRPMDNSRRLALERVLNAKIRARRQNHDLPAEEHERLSRWH